MRGQIYHEYKDCLLPRLGRKLPVLKPHFALMMWPNGKPCSLVNIWLGDLAARTSGKTVKQYCVNLTPYVKFCFYNKIFLVGFSDVNMNDLVFMLTEELTPLGVRRKQNNQVNLVVDAVIKFLMWVEEVGIPADHSNLVGTAKSCPNLTVEVSKSQYGVSYKHEAHVDPNTPLHPKSAIPRSSISLLEDRVFLESDPSFHNGIASHKYTAATDRMAVLRRYMFERRTFIIWMFKKTGLRPEELALMSFDKNRNVLLTNIIYLPTKKRRTDAVTLRPFKVSDEGALYISYYLSARAEFLDFLRKNSSKLVGAEVMLLTEDGLGLSAGSMTRDFSRLSKRAGLSGVRTCLSMFRHRFITLEVLIHLKAVLNTNFPTREMLSAPVIKSIEERIRKKTGHKLGKSIWAYFDAAFDAMKFWGSVEDTFEKIDQINDLEDSVNRMRYKVQEKSIRGTNLSKEIADLQSRILELRSRSGIEG